MRYKDAIETLNVAIDNGVGLLELYKKGQRFMNI